MDALAFKTSTELSKLLRKKQLSSRELLEHYLRRIERWNGRVNAVITLDAERALERARALDDRLVREGPVGPLHGLPMTIKDAYEIAGVRSTMGVPQLAQHLPRENAVAVQRLIDAGGVVFGKTNVPAYCSDLQSYNDLFGVTKNPHDETRTPGGSSGGAAVSLACGFTSLELGSDIGGSIRNPAHWTGVFGHKPSFGIVPERGHMPGPPGTRSQADLSVCGPMARSAEDLWLELQVLAGPDAALAKAYRLELPAARAGSLGGYRIAAWLDDPAFPVDYAVLRVLETALDALRAAGARIDVSARPDLTLAEVHEVYTRLLNPIVASGMPAQVIEQLGLLAKGGQADASVAFASKAVASHLDWLRANERRARYRARFAEFFERYDALLCPVSILPAIAHDHAGAATTRRIVVNGEERPYLDLLGWAGLATAHYLPATVIPAGRTPAGLPVGVQIIGPYLEDRTTIDLGGRASEVLGGFAPPERYAAEPG